MSLAALLSELANHPGAILAWEVDQPTELSLSLFQVEGGTKQLAHTTVMQDQHASIAAELTKLGHVQGAYASMTGLVWRADAGTFTVWGQRGRQFHSDGTTLAFAKLQLVFDASMQVVAFVDDDYISRGVRIATSTGEYTVASHRQLRASLDWSYGALDALADSGWTVYLGRALANFLGVELIDKTGTP